MLKLKKKDDGMELNINAAHVVSFFPITNGTNILTTAGVLYTVSDTTRTVRHQMKKALFGAAEEA